MLKNQIAKPYAAALLDIGRSTNTLEFITDDIKNLLENIFENEELIEYFKNPTYSKKAKIEVLNKIVEPLFINENTKKFLNLLIERSRIDILPLIAKKYLNLVTELGKIKLVYIKSAIPLTGEQETSIVEILKLKLNASDIKLFSAIEKNLLGGFEIKIGDNVLDFSIKGQLKKLAEQLEITL